MRNVLNQLIGNQEDYGKIYDLSTKLDCLIVDYYNQEDTINFNG